jgi:hypothetical protein
MKLIIVLFLILNSFTFGLVLHPDGEPNESWINKPPNSVVAKVGNCSGVVIHPQHILTVGHCPVSYSTPLNVNGIIYYPEKIYSHIVQDFFVIKVIDANFTDFAAIPEYEIMEEGNLDWEIIIGGYGKTRGEEIYAYYDPNLLVGYSWGNNYGELKWGTNEIIVFNKISLYIYFDQVFDTPYECSISTYDSGCGGFVFRDGRWWTVGIGRSVSDYNVSFFLPINEEDPLYMGSRSNFIRTYCMAGWIESIIYNADMNRDEVVDVDDLMMFCEDWLIGEDSLNFVYIFFNSRSDLNRDGHVNFIDFSIFASQWEGSK